MSLFRIQISGRPCYDGKDADEKDDKWRREDNEECCSSSRKNTLSFEGVTDDNSECPYWASIGECTKNAGWMNSNCELSCKTWNEHGTCGGKGDGDCDYNSECAGDLDCGKNNCHWGDGDDCCQEKGEGKTETLFYVNTSFHILLSRVVFKPTLRNALSVPQCKNIV